MKIKLGEFLYTPDDLPIMVILDETDKERISTMEGTRYAQSTPKQFESKEAFDFWMKTDGITQRQIHLMQQPAMGKH